MNDKELIINGKAVCSPEQQVYKNMKDIEALQKIIKTTYKTSSELTSSSASDSTANTNVGTAKEGWLMTEDGLLFRIDGNDGTTLLLTYYADLKGPQGETGSSGDPTLLIDDNGTANNKCWSSQKTNNEIINVNNPGAFTSYTDPTEDDGNYYLSRSNIYPVLKTLKTNDIVIIYDNTDLDNYIIKEIWEVGIINGTSVQVSKIGSIGGGGSQLYQHNIFMKDTTWISRITFTIINDSDTPLTIATISKWLYNKGFTDYNNVYNASGKLRRSNTDFIIFGLCGYSNGNSIGAYGQDIGGNNSVESSMTTSNATITDTIIPL